jgi:hypothetical protein
MRIGKNFLCFHHIEIFHWHYSCQYSLGFGFIFGLASRTFMKKAYSLKGVRKTRAFEGICISASIFFGERQVGTIRDCPDSGKAIFEFPLMTDRIVFEAFIADWWANEADHMSLYDVEVLSLIQQNPSYAPSMQARMRYWVKSIVENRRTSWQVRLAA